MNRKELIEYKKGLKLTDYQRQVLIGTLLGDASIAKQLENRQHNVKFEQSIVKADYIDHLYLIFKDFVGAHPLQYVTSEGVALKIVNRYGLELIDILSLLIFITFFIKKAKR